FERERVDVTKILFDSDVQRGIHLVEGAALDGQIEVYTDRFPMVFAAFRVTVDYMLSHSFLLTKEALTRKASTSFFNRKWPFKIQLHYRVKSYAHSRDYDSRGSVNWRGSGRFAASRASRSRFVTARLYRPCISRSSLRPAIGFWRATCTVGGSRRSQAVRRRLSVWRS